jgi:hypothetical protein
MARLLLLLLRLVRSAYRCRADPMLEKHGAATPARCSHAGQPPAESDGGRPFRLDRLIVLAIIVAIVVDR